MGQAPSACCFLRGGPLFARDVPLIQAAADIPLHHHPRIRARALAWSPEQALIFTAQEDPVQVEARVARKDHDLWSGEGPSEPSLPRCVQAGSGESPTDEEINLPPQSAITAYDPWTAERRRVQGTSLDEVLCVVWANKPGLLLCGGSGSRELIALDDKLQLQWALEPGIGKVRTLIWVQELDMVLCAGVQEVAAFTIKDGEGKLSWCVMPGFLELTSLAWGSCQRFVFAGGSNERYVIGKILAMEPETGKTRWEVDPKVGGVNCLSWSAEQGILFCAGNHAKVAALEPDRGDPIWITDPHVGESKAYGTWNPGVTSLAWAAGSSLLLCGGSHGRVAALDPRSGATIWAVDAMVRSIASLVYIPEMRLTLCLGEAGAFAALVT